MIDPNKVILDGEQSDAIIIAQAAEIRRKNAVSDDIAVRKTGGDFGQPTLTDAERAAIAWCVEMAATTATECDEELAALRGFLERTK